MTLTTRILPVPDGTDLGRYEPADSLEHWHVPAVASSSPGLAALHTAADLLRRTDTPVGFPTETVYGLGADATRSAAVRGIFAAKRRPADNPLIVHVCDLAMLRALLGGDLPAVYAPLVQRFWPGPLTILLPVPASPASSSSTSQPKAETTTGTTTTSATATTRWTLAPEITAGLSTFAARLPASALARSLIRLVDAPLAGPSANASTRPSPTTAQHVVDDLGGRIEAVLDGGPCGVGVESTVVDGLCDPPVVLRPGGISLAQLRAVPGWAGVQLAYRDDHTGNAIQGAPRAPGMKYKHYSPKARVVLFEGGAPARTADDLAAEIQQAVQDLSAGHHVVGLVRTGTWPSPRPHAAAAASDGNDDNSVTYNLVEYALGDTAVLDLDLGRGLASVAHGLFSALRDLDARGAQVILVEGLAGSGDDMAAAVMNRLRKAASDVR